MKSLSDKVYENSPSSIQNILISLYNIRASKRRYGQYYNDEIDFLEKNKFATNDEIKKIQFERLVDFLKYSKKNSNYYRNIIADDFFKSFQSVDDLRQLPFLTKNDIIQNFNEIVTIPKRNAVVANTGGTTGASLKVFYTVADNQRRFAHVDFHRKKRGYELGEKTAWFSGKNFLSGRDIKRNRFWKTDYYNNVRYYSTFHINYSSVEYYLENLVKYRPRFLIGFPSNMFELAQTGLKKGIDFPASIEAVFPNAETITPDMRISIENFFKAPIFDQYGSSEGAPFIFETGNENYHFDAFSGIFEVLDDEGLPTDEGRLVVTSFFTKGTPLIRYDIGDIVRLKKSDTDFTSVERIIGRESEFIYSEETGKINGVNLNNCTKKVKGVMRFKVVQNSLNKLDLYLVIDERKFSQSEKNNFISNIRQRIGSNMSLNVEIVDSIDKEKSGKFRFIENNVKNQLPS
ncbi:MAG: phenylacetate--CoA ligase family protein [Cyclobacteriaceae bacterium]|nr:phenylacetate--CoA ligase family protein [Cyclobacteriaceae bacterium]